MSEAKSGAGSAEAPHGATNTGDVPPYIDLAWHGDDRSRPGPRRSLDVRAIAATGVGLADEAGLGGVSMRSVGARLGMTSMGLYRYFKSKDELLALMIDEALGPPAFPAYGSENWRDRLTAWSYAARARYKAHPWVLAVSLSEPPALPNQITWTERGLEALWPTHMTESEKLSALLLVNVYVRGQTQLAAGFGQAGPDANQDERYARLLLRLADPERFPHLVAAMTQRATSPRADFADHEFGFGLSTVLNGIASRT
jgi:AcrR family transcriptional regulator